MPRFSQKYADHNNELSLMSSYLSTGGVAERLRVPTEQVTALAAFSTAHSAAYALYKDPNTHNDITRKAMKVADENAYAFVLPFRQQIKNGSAPLTQTDFGNLFIHQDKQTREKAPRPTEVPTVLKVKTEPLALTYEATLQTTDGVNRVALPHGMHLVREQAIVPIGTEVTDADYHPLDDIGHGRFEIVYVQAEVGMNVYLRCCYANSRGERGPMSEPAVDIVTD